MDAWLELIELVAQVISHIARPVDEVQALEFVMAATAGASVMGWASYVCPCEK